MRTKATRKKRHRTPREARTFDQICELPRDNWSKGNYWFMLGPGEVTIAEQKTGEMARWMATMPRSVFEAFVRAYETGSLKRTP